MPIDPVEFVARHGVVLASAKGSVPNLAEAVAGEPIRGSWWGHPKGQEIFQALNAVDASPDVLTFRLVDGKVTFVHRRLWAALARLSKHFGKKPLTAVRQEHTATGAHRNLQTPFPKWVPPAVMAAARELTEEEAHTRLGEWSRVDLP